MEERRLTPSTDKIAVTGATGLVGSHLIAELLKSGYENILVILRGSGNLDVLYKTLKKEKSDFEGKLEIAESSLCNPVKLSKLLCGVTTIFHCAATVSLGGADDNILIGQNTEITSNLINSSLECAVKKFVYVSSIASLSNGAGADSPATEKDLLQTVWGIPAYSAGKLICEHEVMRGNFCGLKTITVNPAVILGSCARGGGSNSIIPLLTKGIPFYTEGNIAVVDVYDVARALRLLAEQEFEKHESFILCSGSVPYKELLTIAAKISHKPAPFIKLNRNSINLVRKLLSRIYDIARKGETPLTEQIVNSLFKKYYFDGSKIKKTVNFDYLPIEETIRRVTTEYKERNGDK